MFIRLHSHSQYITNHSQDISVFQICIYSILCFRGYKSKYFNRRDLNKRSDILQTHISRPTVTTSDDYRISPVSRIRKSICSCDLAIRIYYTVTYAHTPTQPVRSILNLCAYPYVCIYIRTIQHCTVCTYAPPFTVCTVSMPLGKTTPPSRRESRSLCTASKQASNARS